MCVSDCGARVAACQAHLGTVLRDAHVFAVSLRERHSCRCKSSVCIAAVFAKKLRESWLCLLHHLSVLLRISCSMSVSSSSARVCGCESLCYCSPLHHMPMNVDRL
jgi:hypothetical protein